MNKINNLEKSGVSNVVIWNLLEKIKKRREQLEQRLQSESDK
jgi:hypothetical protein